MVVRVRGGLGTGAWVPNAFARSAAGVHLSLRWGTRILQVLSPHLRTNSSGWRTAVGACAAGDLAGAAIMKRQVGRRHYGRWLAADAADIALWSAAGDGTIDGWNQEQVLGLPLAMDAGARFGARALVVPVVGWVSGAVVHRWRGQPLRPGAIGWQVFGVAVGAAAAARSRLIGARVRARRDQELAARRHAAWSAGQNAEATGVDNDVDRLERALALLHLGAPSPGPDPGAVATWKAGMAITSRASAVYLGDTLFAWQRARNAHPDLSGVVRLHLRPGQGVTLLTAAQALDLGLRLDARALSGEVFLELAGRVEPRPGQRLDLWVNGEILTVDRDLDRATVVPDPLPTALFTSAAFQLLPLLAQYGSVPWRKAAAPALCTLGLGLVNERVLWSGNALDARGILIRASPLALWSSVVATTSSRPPTRSAGGASAGFFGPFAAHQVLVGFCLHRLTRHQQAASLLVGVGWFAGLLRLLPERLDRRSTLAELVTPVAVTVFANSLAQGYEEEARRATSIVEGQEGRLLEESYLEGREGVRTMVKAALAEAWLVFHARAGLLDDDVRDEVRRRLRSCGPEEVQLEPTPVGPVVDR